MTEPPPPPPLPAPSPVDFLVRPAVWNTDAAGLMSVRTTVFVDEQNVPMELERDGLDPACRHVLAFALTANGTADETSPIGVGRVTASGHIGRVAVLADWRGRGVGTALIRCLIEQADASVVDLNSQTHAIPFYQRLGFVVTGDEFEEAGIPHRRMMLKKRVGHIG